MLSCLLYTSIATREAYGKALVELGAVNDKVVVLDADLAGATMTKHFKAAYPERFFDCGIAEANMMNCLLYTSCKDALGQYLAVRRPISGRDREALFLSRNNRRISRSTVNLLVKKHLSAAGLDSTRYSSHKLRHTAATLMLQNGVDVKAVQEVLGHEHLNTTEIYTHIDNEALRVAAKANPLSREMCIRDRYDPRARRDSDAHRGTSARPHRCAWRRYRRWSWRCPCRS